jgi:soluble lytic murein transglycosylase-like protein
MKTLLSFIAMAVVSASASASINDIVTEKSRLYKVDANLIKAVIQAESAYNPKAVSKAGAVGLMQLMPETAKRFGVFNRLDVKQNIDGGVRYLKVLLDMFDNNIKLAVAGYNAGENAVINHGYKIPPYKETREYVKKVVANMAMSGVARHERKASAYKNDSKPSKILGASDKVLGGTTKII